MNYENFVYQQPIDPIRQAILLAMTQSMEQEKEMIRYLQGMGIKCVATMASGFNSDISPKLVNNLVGACLNANIIEKKKSHIHPVVHALHEAMDTSRVTREISQNCRLKVGVVRYEDQISICIYGDLAIHELSAHKTVGVGFQILGE